MYEAVEARSASSDQTVGRFKVRCTQAINNPLSNRHLVTAYQVLTKFRPVLENCSLYSVLELKNSLAPGKSFYSVEKSIGFSHFLDTSRAQDIICNNDNLFSPESGLIMGIY
jgi:hypothetical protein